MEVLMKIKVLKLGSSAHEVDANPGMTVLEVLDKAGLTARARADHEEVETSVLTGDGPALLIAVNHAAVPVETTVRLSGRAEPLRLSLPARSGQLTRL